MISCIVPAHNEKDYIEETLYCLKRSAQLCPEDVEILVVENGTKDGTRKILRGCVYTYIPEASRTKAKNVGAFMARGDTLVFVDADCLVSSDFFSEVMIKSKMADGGGVDHVKLTRYSLGIYCFLVIVAFKLLWHRIRVGAFWVRREVFEQMGGFEDFVLDDIDFAKRLKKYNTSSLEECSILWSTRKFDKHGDWYWLGGYK